MKLLEIAEIRTGLVLSRKQAPIFENAKNAYKLLTLSSVNEAGWINEQQLDIFFSNENISEEYFARVGDVIMRLSSPNTAVAIEKCYEGILIPSQFAIIRCDQKKILSGYLNVSLNGKKIQAKLAQARNGTVIQTISTISLKELEINLISIDKQKYLVEFSKLVKRKALIQNKLVSLEKLLLNNAINKMLIGEIK